MSKPFKTSIGGQALIEGVMMRGPEKSAMSVRIPDTTIDTEVWDNPASMQKWYRKTPFLRGVFNMVDSLLIGYKCLMRSAEKAGMEEEEPSKFEKWLSEKLGKNLTTIVAAVALVLGLALAVGLFIILPTALTGLLSSLLGVPFSPGLKALLEGVLKIVIFLIYLLLVSKMGEIKRVFEYHGAEHKTIACYEAKLPLTVENVRPQVRFHPRCGTSFILIVLVISILTTSIIRFDHVVARVVLKMALLPVVVGISYEIIKYAGRHDNPFTRILSAPGLWFQRLTTKEPDDSQIEVAIASMTPVIPEGGTDQW